MDRDQIEEIVYTFAKFIKSKKMKTCSELIERLAKLENNDKIIDSLIDLSVDLVKKNKVKIGDLYSNVNLLVGLSEKYPDEESIIKKLELLNKKNH